MKHTQTFKTTLVGFVGALFLIGCGSADISADSTEDLSVNMRSISAQYVDIESANCGLDNSYEEMSIEGLNQEEQSPFSNIVRGIGENGIVKGIGENGIVKGIGENGLSRGIGENGIVKGVGENGFARFAATVTEGGETKVEDSICNHYSIVIELDVKDSEDVIIELDKKTYATSVVDGKVQIELQVEDINNLPKVKVYSPDAEDKALELELSIN